MLTVVKKVFGKSIEQLAAELDATKAEALAALDEIARLQRARADVDSWERAQQIDQEISKLRWTIERYDRRIEKLEQQLGSARAEAQGELLKSITAPWAGLMKQYLASSHATLDIFGGLVAIRAELERHGFHAALNALTLPPNVAGSPILASDLLARFAAELQPRAKSPQASRPTKPAVRPPAPRSTDSQRRVSLAEAPAVPPRKPRPLRNDSVPTDKTRSLVEFVRSSVEFENGVLSRVGDRVSLPTAQANALIQNGAATLAKTDVTANGVTS